MLPFVSGVSEEIRGVCSHHNLRVVFRPGLTLRTMLSRVKHSKVVYRIPCDCGKVYIGETTQRLETRLKEHRNADNKGNTKTSAVA